MLDGARLSQRLSYANAHLQDVRLVRQYGTVIDIQGPIVRIAAPDLQVGDICEFITEPKGLLGEVIGFQDKLSLVTPLGSVHGLGPGTLVERRGDALDFEFSEGLLGGIVSGLGELITPKPEGAVWTRRSVRNSSIAPMDRTLIDTPVCTGLRVIDGLTTLAGGQRIALFGPPGAGKSTLLAGIASNFDADVIVFGLIGERGREISEFVARKIPPETRERLVVVAAPADRPALERIHAANVATAIAEGFRDNGKSVLLILDSLTRVARAMREVGLAAGEPPTRRGYPASVFARLPELIERPGRTSKGQITAVYAVLSEGDVSNDPVVEETRSLVDGHIALDAKVFASGRFPAIDVMDSLSRMMRDVVSPRHMALATDMRNIISRYEQVELLVQIGEYSRGQDPETDRALDLYPEVVAFLSQPDMDAVSYEDTLEAMERICG
ncbi:MAG: FliI/YscN family ATPase [Pseudomonadota bacterium]